MFLSSHLMSEMALTAEHLVIVGRGRVIADTTVDDVRRAGLDRMRRARADARRPTRAARRARRPGRDGSRATSAGVLEVHGLSSERDRRGGGRERQLVLHELTPQQRLARRRLHAPDRRLGRVPRPTHPTSPAARRSWSRRHDATAHRTRQRPSRGRVTQGRVVALGVDEAVVAALHALVAARRRRRRSSGSACSSPPSRSGRWATSSPRRPRALRLDRLRRRRLPPGAAGDRRARRAGDQRRVLDRDDPLEPRWPFRKRLPVLWAKLGVFAGVTFVLMLVVDAHLVLRRAGDLGVATTSNHSLGDPARAARGDRDGAVPHRAGRARRRPRGADPQHRRRHRVARRAAVRPAGHHGAPAVEHAATRSARTCRSAPAARWPRSTFDNPHHLAPWAGFAVFCAYAAVDHRRGRRAIGASRRLSVR